MAVRKAPSTIRVTRQRKTFGRSMILRFRERQQISAKGNDP